MARAQEVLLINPWAQAGRQPVSPQTTDDWARPFAELVDPWAHSEWTESIDLIVDPWAPQAGNDSKPPSTRRRGGLRSIRPASR